MYDVTPLSLLLSSPRWYGVVVPVKGVACLQDLEKGWPQNMCYICPVVCEYALNHVN